MTLALDAGLAERARSDVPAVGVAWRQSCTHRSRSPPRSARQSRPAGQCLGQLARRPSCWLWHFSTQAR